MKIGIIGGHLSPAVAVIDKVPEGDSVLFFGRKYAFEKDTTPSLEYQTITKRDIPFISITTGRLQRKLTLSGLLSFLKIPRGFLQARGTLSENKPDVVVGFGGYLSVPVCLAAKTLGIPVVIHEQTLEAGLANKIIARFADKICLSWEESRSFFPEGKVIITGNPMKNYQLSTINYQLSNENLPLIYVTGGSTGAHELNVLLEQNLSGLLKKYCIIHQTGDAKEYGDYDRLQALRLTFPENIQKRYHVQKFIAPSEVGMLMQRADLIISRSGINTVTELLYFGKPSLLLPLLYGQKNEQLKNATFVKNVGLAEIIDQKNISPGSFGNLVDSMMSDLSRYKSNAEKARQLINPHAAEKIYEVIAYVAKKTSS